jgi:hypothetical protein
MERFSIGTERPKATDREGADGNTHAGNHAGGQRQPARIGRKGHGHHTQGINGQTDGNGAASANAIGIGAGKRLGDTPGQVLDCHGHAPALARQPEIAGHGQGKQAKAAADAIAHGRDDATGNDQHKQGNCGTESGGGHAAASRGGCSIYARGNITQSNIKEWTASIRVMSKPPEAKQQRRAQRPGV